MKKFVSLRFTVSTYCRITPLCPAYGGGSHDRVAVRDVTAVTVRLAGGAVGTAKYLRRQVEKKVKVVN